MVEPWVTAWSRFVYGRFHHEPFDPDTDQWSFQPQGPLSGANGALPWVILERDREHFEAEFPQWKIDIIEPFMPLLYLLSGGLSVRSIVPSFTFGFWSSVERLIHPWSHVLAMFAHIKLTRTSEPASDKLPDLVNLRSGEPTVHRQQVERG